MLMSKLREGAGGWVAKIFLGLLILSFAVWGIADVFRGIGAQDVAVIGSSKIGTEEFRRLYTERLQMLSRQFGRGTWAAVSATYYAGGRTSLNGVARDDRQSGSRFGATLALPLGGGHSLKLFGSTGLSARTGTDFNTIGVAWQYLWQ